MPCGEAGLALVLAMSGPSEVEVGGGVGALGSVTGEKTGLERRPQGVR